MLKLKKLLILGAVLLAAPTADAGPLRRIVGRAVCPAAPVFPATGVQWGQPYQTIPPAGVPPISPGMTMPQSGVLSFPQRPLIQAVGHTVYSAALIPAAAVQGVGQVFGAAPQVCGPTGCR